MLFWGSFCFLFCLYNREKGAVESNSYKSSEWQSVLRLHGKIGLQLQRAKASKVHDFIKEFNAIERVIDRPVAHPQDAWSTLSLSLFDLCLKCVHIAYVGWLSSLLTQSYLNLRQYMYLLSLKH